MSTKLSVMHSITLYSTTKGWLGFPKHKIKIKQQGRGAK